MVCFTPNDAFITSEPSDLTGKRVIRFRHPGPGARLKFEPIQLPCGQCTGCRLDRSRMWAIRCVHEASLYDDNCFVTLTYDDDHLPEDRSLDYVHFQLFMKRLRDRTHPGIRFYMCGEYGETTRRPHYHALFFNFNPSDRRLFQTRGDTLLYTSELLSKSWKQGFVTVGDVSFQSAAYVSRYVMKKVTGPAADQHYEFVNPLTGEVTRSNSEFTEMSRRPGIGRGWWDKWKHEVFPDDFVVVDGKKMRPPRYYEQLFNLDDPDGHLALKEKRKETAVRRAADATPERLRVREKVLNSKLSKLVRNL